MDFGARVSQFSRILMVELGGGMSASAMLLIWWRLYAEQANLKGILRLAKRLAFQRFANGAWACGGGDA